MIQRRHFNLAATAAVDGSSGLPDLSRRCAAVAPDEHHLLVCLGCAAENLVPAALAHGLKGEVDSGATVRVRDHCEFDGLRVATRGDAVYRDPEGDFVYGRFVLKHIHVDVAP